MLFERNAVSLFERGKRAKQVEERERVRERERERDDDVVVVVLVVVGVKFHSAGPQRESFILPERKKNIKREEKKKVSKEKRKKKSHEAYRRVLIDIMLLHFDRPFLRVVIYSQQKQSKERDHARVIIL